MRIPVLPDFMVFLNWKELPWFWYGFDNSAFAALMVVAVPGLLAFVFGWLAFRSRVTGVYLSIITQAMTYALMLAFFRNEMGFGGNNGLTDFKDILGFDIQAQGTRIALYVATVVALALTYIDLPADGDVDLRQGAGCDPRCGKPDAVPRLPRRDTTSSWRSSSRPAWQGIAGALYVPQVGIINPSEFAPANSIEAVIWVAVGGRGTLTGAALGRGDRQLRQDGLHHRCARAVLAVRARRAVRRHDAVPAEGHRRHGRAICVGRFRRVAAGRSA